VAGQERKLEETRERRSEVELDHEKSLQRGERLQDQVQTLEERKTALAVEKARALEELERNRKDTDSKAVQLASIDLDKHSVERHISQVTASLSDLAERRNSEEQTIEQLRQLQFEAVGREARIRNEILSRRETIGRIGAQAERLEREEGEAGAQAAEFSAQLNAAREEHSGRQVGFGQLKNRLHEAEETHSRYKREHSDAVKAAAEAKAQEENIRHRLQTIGELAVQRAYSTESVQQFFNHVRGLDWAPLGILADFVEVEHEYESLVEDFLRWELQYVVVEDRAQAEHALAVVKSVSKGRLDCLVRNGSTNTPPPIAIENATPLGSVIRFDDRVRHFDEYIRDAYIVDSVERAWELSERYPKMAFVARTGEVVRGHIVSWGEHEALGPLSLKREIRELDRKMDQATRRAADLQEDMARLEQLFHESEALKARLLFDLQEAEKAILSMDHRVQSLTADFERADQRLRLATAEISRLAEERGEVEKSLVEAEHELNEIAGRKAAIEEEMQSRSRRSEELGTQADNLRRDFAGLQSQLAVLEERRSTVTRELNALHLQATELEDRASHAETQIQQANEQQEQTRASIRSLEETRRGLVQERDYLDQAIAETTATLENLRKELQEAEAKWDETRGLLDTWKDRHNALEIEKTQVDSDLKHLAETCFHELNETIESVCLISFDTLPPGELEIREKEYRELREKIDSMGAVNMMAVEEYQEAEERFQFLTTQRQDLLDSIRDTAQAIEEIDSVCRRQFKEAFEAINTGFTQAFVDLFGGGHGELRLLEGAGETDAGVEIVAQPPGKKLQNVLLLSGGEKALAALALLIALFRYKPSPFCVLDEVDAPLDDANVDRFANMVRDMSSNTQFIVITHSKRTMETASTLYGVTMEEPGISKIVSVRLN
jgi:chromosome segregation protein